MLCINTYISLSKISGNGLFSNEFIEEGRIIWEYMPLVDITYNISQWRKLQKELSKESFSVIKNYAYKENDSYIVCFDNAQFMNHCGLEFNVANTKDLKSMFATRDIQKGEELLCDYFEYSDKDDHHRLFLESGPKTISTNR